MGGAEEVGGVTWFALGCRKPSVNIGWAFLLLFFAQTGLKDSHLAL